MSEPKSVRAVIFDMDGVLLDSVAHNRSAFDMVLNEFGLSVADIEIRHGQAWRGGSLKDLLKLVSLHYGLELEFEDFSRRAGDHMLDRLAGLEVVADPDLIRLLDELHQAGFVLGIGTSSVRWRTERILTQLGISKHFQEVVNAEDVSVHKPDPEVYLETARRLGVAPECCVVVEDAAVGVEAAKRAGMKVIGFLEFNADSDSLSHANLLVHSFHELTVQKITEVLAGD